VLLDQDGALDATDQRRASSFVDRFDVPVSQGERVRVTVTSTAFDTVLEVTPPRGVPLSNDDVAGDRTRSEIELVAPVAGALKVQVTSFTPSAQGAYHVRVERVREASTVNMPRAAAPSARRHHVTTTLLASLTNPTPVRLGDRVSGNLADGDARLDSGEHADVYVLDVREPTDLRISMESSGVDSYLLAFGPNAMFENDDSGGALNAAVTVTAAPAGSYRIIATSYRAGMTGSYELKVLSSRDAAGSDAPVAGGEERITNGALASGDRTLSSGEFVDEHRFTWSAGTAVHLEARSTEFDSYLIVRAPSGEQRDNDDQAPGIVNAALDFVAQEAGEHRVLVTSYRPGETGNYELVIRGGGESPAPNPGNTGTQNAPASPNTPRPSSSDDGNGVSRVIRGTLASGDTTLPTGEFFDTHTVQFPAGSPARIRLESPAFDTYLIVRSPSGRQDDNDDLAPGLLHSGIDIPSAEAGDYRIVVTSYRPGETGSYTLNVGNAASGSASPSSPTAPAAPAPAGSGSRVWVLSIGISDYPGGGNDLPECANDASKIAEALRNQGLTTPEREILLTNSQATTSAIRAAMQRIASQIRPDETFVFFYSGHGGQSSSQSNDSRELDGRDEFLFVYDGEFADDEFGRLTDAIRARTALVAIDACFAGGFAKDVITRPGVIGMFSSEEDVTSAVAGQFQAGGYLSHFLRLGIQGQADEDPRDHVLTVGELTHFVWQQYGRHASSVRMQMGYQHLVIDRGAVSTTQELWRANR
jgi:hypothetical protein